MTGRARRWLTGPSPSEDVIALGEKFVASNFPPLPDPTASMTLAQLLAERQALIDLLADYRTRVEAYETALKQVAGILAEVVATLEAG